MCIVKVGMAMLVTVLVAEETESSKQDSKNSTTRTSQSKAVGNNKP